MKVYALIFVALIICSFPVYAANETAFLDLPDDFVVESKSKIRLEVKNLKISDTEFVGEETEEELKDPLLTDQEAEAIMVRGIISVYAEWCGLDWKKQSFSPFMKEKRDEGKTEKQMAFIGVLHGFGMGIMKKKLNEASCKEENKKKIDPFLYNDGNR